MFNVTSPKVFINHTSSLRQFAHTEISAVNFTPNHMKDLCIRDDFLVDIPG